MSASTRTTRDIRSQLAARLRTFDPKISYQALPGTKEVEITLIVDEKWSPVAIEVLGFMDQMVRSIEHYGSAGFRDMRTERMIADQEAMFNVVRRRYTELRAEGVRHRKAVYKLVADRTLPFHARWNYTDYNWCVRARSRAQSTRSLKQV